MKRFVGLLSIFALVFLLSACGNSENDKKTDESSTLTETSSSTKKSTKESSSGTSKSSETIEPVAQQQQAPTADEVQASIDAEDARLEAEWQQQLQDNAAESARVEAEAQRIQDEQRAAADAESARAEAEAQRIQAEQQAAVDAENQRMAEQDKANGY